jgi:pimeloyl-ACP methyl ester carboxylesterase
LTARTPARRSATGLEVTEVGGGDRRVVFVHGVLDRGRSFNRVARELDGGCHVAWYDRRGYGTSRELAGAPAAIDQHVDDLVAVLDGRPAVLMGHSFGGVAALGAAVRAPDLVDAVVVYETSIAWAPGWDDDGMSAIYSAPDPEGAALELMLGRAVYERMDDDERAWRRIEARAFLVEEQSVRAGPPYDIARITAPVVYGHGDEIVMPKVVEFLGANIDRFEVVRIPGAGHHAHRTHSDGVAQLVRTALARSERDGASR